MKKIITFGTFDVLHIGHINILERAKSLGEELIVGVSSDILNFQKKNRFPVYDQVQRIKILESLKFVNHVFIEESLELKREYVLMHGADILVMGKDWEGKLDYLMDICEVVYLERTPSISTTEVIKFIKKL